ncbi:MAG: methylated-DNA-[protein]-cysteine S-methyltransferase [Hyphomicrobiaceae bacterium]|jgi:methylated-DNA-[protein]-cysteine S-methyltransferase
MNIELERFPTPVGEVVLATIDTKVAALGYLDGWDEFAARVFRGYDDVHFVERATHSKAGKQLEAYFSGDATVLYKIEVETRGTPFQKSVWNQLRRIPHGTTISYGELAQRIGNPKASRAVGTANGANPVSIIVPCHRVIAASGDLGGYAFGLNRKRWLLAHESGTGTE